MDKCSDIQDKKQIIRPEFTDLIKQLNEHINKFQNRVTEKRKKVTTETALYNLQSVKVDLAEELPEPAVCLKIKTGTFYSILGTLGNFSLIIGKAKSRKTFLVIMFLASMIVDRLLQDKFRGVLPGNKTRVAFFDNEQGKNHVQRAAQRICRLAGIEQPVNLDVFGLRKYKPSERLILIEEYLYNTPDLGYVVIDGVRDLITSINDEEQACEITSKLLKWTEELNIHIVCILHQNKGNDNARGHIGTELQNKGETVLSITKDPENKHVSVVEAEYCRDREPEPFAFEIDENGLPVICEHWIPSSGNRTAQRQTTPGEIPEHTHNAVLNDVFGISPRQKYSELHSTLKLTFNNYGQKFGDSKIKDFIQYYVNTGMISKHGNKPHTFYTTNKPEFGSDEVPF
jgi:hypothetical protein